VTAIRSGAVDLNQLAELRSRRFSQLPLDCGNDRAPGVNDSEEWQDWTVRSTTPDQLRIENYLDRFDLGDRAILHVGIGNSGLAKRFSMRANSIFGTSISPEEIEYGKALQLPNYRLAIHNKYSSAGDGPRGEFDFIVDNNPTSFCCCLKHLANMLELYGSRLSSTGQIVTDRLGLRWTPGAPLGNPGWSFCFEDISAVAALVGLTAYRIDENLYVLARSRPNLPPGFLTVRARIRSFVMPWMRKARRAGRAFLR